jgi:hypothetical protein
MNQQTEYKMRQAIECVAGDMMQRPCGANIEEIIKVLTPLYPDFEFRKHGDNIIWRDIMPATAQIIPFPQRH